jgi:hypothetical protein
MHEDTARYCIETRPVANFLLKKLYELGTAFDVDVALFNGSMVNSSPIDQMDLESWPSSMEQVVRQQYHFSMLYANFR